MERNEEKYDVEKFRAIKDYRLACFMPSFDRIPRNLKWRGGERVLDIGCGPGDITKVCIYPILPQNYEKLVCSDISPEMLEVCKSVFAGIKSVEFLQMDIRESPAESLKGTFDRIFSTFCFMYVADQEAALKNVFDLLAPGGDCWIHQLSRPSVVLPLFKLAESPKWKDKLQGFRTVQIYPFTEDPNPVATGEKYMKSVGFTDISVSIVESHVQMESEEDSLIESLPNPSKDFNEEDKQELLKDQIAIAKSLNFFKNNSTSDPKKVPEQFLVMYGLTGASSTAEMRITTEGDQVEDDLLDRGAKRGQ
ncbi:juvenile hormone acid O-methyltransferase-like [Phlebotomus argentipes]|uniref:juvenile hormone acid O-methyltransferase-like n=1 Tax=Phlebotomus argentipes TaxID=94469 RepID=UPI002892EAF1|nr:juvenile hormone acid O-methyltransferase-like [Phlebotomus argentipes]